MKSRGVIRDSHHTSMALDQMGQGAQAAKVLSEADTGSENLLGDLLGGMG